MTSGPKARLAVLLSGRGSNSQALAQAVAAGQVPAEIVLVFSNRPEAPGLEIARRLGLPTAAIPGAGRERADYDRLVVAELRQRNVEWVCLAGYMRLLSGVLLEAFPGRILNIHPSLLPAFPGLEAQRQALEYGVKFSGCTVHWVDETLDGGPILAQAVVPVLDGDDEASLAARILEQEHRLYPEALRLALSGAWRLTGRRVLGRPE
ncbi:MAG: phosphoribosylglycinamide formyltransferase [Terriglobales bacterium]